MAMDPVVKNTLLQIGQVLIQASDSSPIVMGLILGGLITIAAGLTAAEVSAAMPETGGMMVYMR